MYTILEFKNDATEAIAHRDDYTTKTYHVIHKGSTYTYNMIEKWDHNGELATLGERYWINSEEVDYTTFLTTIALVFTKNKRS